MTTAHPRAVYQLECSYDGAIPADEMARARAIDAAFEAANPEYRTLTYNEQQAKEALGQVCMTIKAHKAREALYGKRRDARFCEDLKYVVGVFRWAMRQVRAERAGGAA